MNRSETDCDPYIYPILDWDGNPGNRNHYRQIS